MEPRESQGHKNRPHGRTDSDNSLAQNIAAFADEVGRLTRQAATDDVDVSLRDGRAHITLAYDLGGGV